MSDTRHLLIIDPALAVPEEQGVQSTVHGWDGTWEVRRPALAGDGPSPDTGYEGIDGVVVFGSAASVHDDHPWLAELSAWLRPIVRGERRLPLFGICFGHQLVAHLLEGRVDFLREDRSKLVAYEDTELGGRLVGAPRDPEAHRVIASHREAVVEVPEVLEIVGRRPQSPHDALQHRSLPIFTVQYHPEARDDFATRVGLDPSGVDDDVVASSRRILGAFQDVVRRHAG